MWRRLRAFVPLAGQPHALALTRCRPYKTLDGRCRECGEANGRDQRGHAGVGSARIATPENSSTREINVTQGPVSGTPEWNPGAVGQRWIANGRRSRRDTRTSRPSGCGSSRVALRSATDVAGLPTTRRSSVKGADAPCGFALSVGGQSLPGIVEQDLGPTPAGLRIRWCGTGASAWHRHH